MNTKYDLNGKVKMFSLSRYDSNIWLRIESISRNPLVFFPTPHPLQKHKIGTNYNTGTAIQSIKFWLRQYLEVILIHWKYIFLKWSTTKQIPYKLTVFQEIKTHTHKEMKTAIVFFVLFTLCYPNESGREWFTFYPFSKF